MMMNRKQIQGKWTLKKCKGVGYAHGPPNYTIEFPNIILYISIKNDTNVKMSICFKGMKDARTENIGSSKQQRQSKAWKRIKDFFTFQCFQILYWI